MAAHRDLVKVLNSATFHLSAALFWAGLLIPTLLLWKSSILWIASMSLYANFVGHWSAYQAARAEKSGGGLSADQVREIIREELAEYRKDEAA